MRNTPRTCPHASPQSTRVTEDELRSRGILMLGSKDYDDKMALALKNTASRVYQEETGTYCCHILNQFPHLSSSSIVNKLNKSLSGVYIHAPNQTDIMKCSSVMGTGVQTSTPPAMGCGPVRPLQLGDVHALINVAGTKSRGAEPRFKSIGLVSQDLSDLPKYEQPPGYEDPKRPAYEK